MFAELWDSEKSDCQPDVSDPDGVECKHELHHFDCGAVDGLDNDDEHKDFQDRGPRPDGRA